jgi:leucyl-tRNA synthetase
MAGYDFAAIETKWQQYWAQHETFRQPNPGEAGFRDRPKLYVLDMFPYPSGAGLHVGHPEGYTATDIVSRYGRMKGYNVLHPMGYDSFGLPAEQYAVEHGVHPRQTTAANIANIERQIKMFGFSYDWSRRLATTDPDYYRWTQWIFLQLFNSWFDPETQTARPIKELTNKLQSGKLVIGLDGQIVSAEFFNKIPELNLNFASTGQTKFYELPFKDRRAVIDQYRLAYQAEVPVNWCPQLGTVLANEEVTNEGKSDRGNFPVYRRALKQWMLRITAYAERLEKDLELLDWPEPIKIMQRNWIGKSVGAEVDFVLGNTAFPGCAEVTPGSQELEPNQQFLRIEGINEEHRPPLSAKDFEGHNPYPPGEPSPENLMKQIRNLPHLRIPGATYFVSWHCRPGVVLNETEKETVFQSMLHWHGSRCIVFAAVVMNDHAHMVLRPLAEWQLEKITQSVKGYSSRLINQERGERGHIWGEESFDHIVRDSNWLTKFIYYICDNPIKKGLAAKWTEYPYLFINADFVFTEKGEAFGHEDTARKDTAWKGCDTDEWFDRRQDRGMTTEPEGNVIRVYTTRPDTLYGATYMVLAPEHELVEQITTPEQLKSVMDYVRQAANKSDMDRMTDTKEKTGVFTGACAINPVTRQPIPVWVADYVMMGYGTGAIMAVPAHDTRDFEFAQKFNLPIVQVVQPPEGVDWHGYVDDGVAVNSDTYNGTPTQEFKARITKDLAEAGLGRAATNYKLRDWLFSRQRYWGEPFPIIHCDVCGTVALDERDLPLTLPEMSDFTPMSSNDPNALPQPPLGKVTDWVNAVCPLCGAAAKRELNTMPQWAGSCWYYLRYLDPKNTKEFCGRDVEKYWMTTSGKPLLTPAQSSIVNRQSSMGIDLYVGGAEHAVLHLLYARFWHKVLFDLGHVSTPEPFGKLFNQGMITSFTYRDQRGVSMPYDKIDFSGDKAVLKETGEALTVAAEKMSKSLKNVINPDDIIGQYGADTFRLYEMFMGPLEGSKPWNTRDIPGVHRFLQRVWRMILGSDDQKPLLEAPPSPLVAPPSPLGGVLEVVPDLDRPLHRLVKKAGEDIEAMKFNTTIAAMMDFVNQVYKVGRIARSQAETFLLVLAPFAPHVAEELWQQLGHDGSLAHEPWPAYDPALVAVQTVEMPVQVNGKLRGRIQVAPDADEATVLAAAIAAVQDALAGKTIVKKIVVPKRMVNLVAK